MRISDWSSDVCSSDLDGQRRHAISAGLGADCVPPLSIVVDAMGVHFDPKRPSGLENLLQNGIFTPDLIKRAQDLRAAIVASGLSKYERGGATALPRTGGDRRHVLVPGQGRTQEHTSELHSITRITYA